MDKSEEIKRRKIENAGGNENKDRNVEEKKVSNNINEKGGKEDKAEDEDKEKSDMAPKSEIKTKTNKKPDLRYYVKMKMKKTVIDKESTDGS